MLCPMLEMSAGRFFILRSVGGAVGRFFRSLGIRKPSSPPPAASTVVNTGTSNSALDYNSARNPTVKLDIYIPVYLCQGS